MKIALIGNQNSGKTTLFNALTISDLMIVFILSPVKLFKLEALFQIQSFSYSTFIIFVY